MEEGRGGEGAQDERSGGVTSHLLSGYVAARCVSVSLSSHLSVSILRRRSYMCKRGVVSTKDGLLETEHRLIESQALYIARCNTR